MGPASHLQLLPPLGPTPRDQQTQLPLPRHSTRVQSEGRKQKPRAGTSGDTDGCESPAQPTASQAGTREVFMGSQGQPTLAPPTGGLEPEETGERGHVPAACSSGTAGWTGAAAAGARRSATASSAASSCALSPQTASSAEWPPDLQSGLI